MPRSKQKVIRNPRGVEESVLKALHRITEEKGPHFSASIDSIYEKMDMTPMPSLTTAYRAFLRLAEGGTKVIASHTGSRRNPYRITVLPNGADSVEGVTHIVQFEKQVSTVVDKLLDKDKVIKSLEAELDATRKECNLYREEFAKLTNKLAEVVEV